MTFSNDKILEIEDRSVIARVRDKGKKMLQRGSGCDYKNRRGPLGDSGYRDLDV